jgi:hypothetical protein
MWAFSRSRLRDGRANLITFEQYREWVDAIDADLDDTDAISVAALGRYADATITPPDPTPRHLLVDIDAADYIRGDTAGTQEELHLDGVATEVRDGRVGLQVNNSSVPATVFWDAAGGRYRFESSVLKSLDSVIGSLTAK